MKEFFGEEDLAEMRRIRDVFNPRGLCNPGKALPTPGRCIEPGAKGKLPLEH